MAEFNVAREMVVLLGAIGGLLAMFTGVIFWAVRAQVNSVKNNNQAVSQRLQTHIDERLNKFSVELQSQSHRLDGHDLKIHERELAELKLRNEVLESMRNHYVRHSDVEEIKKQLDALFQRLDRMIFRRPTAGTGTEGGGSS